MRNELDKLFDLVHEYENSTYGSEFAKLEHLASLEAINLAINRIKEKVLNNSKDEFHDTNTREA